MYGSWGEYGALSAGGNSALASGSGLNNGNSSTAQSTWSRLTFANTGGSGSCSFGCYNFDLVSDKVVSQFNEKTVNITSSSLNLNSLSGKDASGNKVVYRRSGSLDLTGTTIDQGKSIIIQATGTVTISGDIRYNDGPYSNIRDIPQVIIQAPTIQIRGGVGQVDAWLFALNGSGGGVLDTCSDRLSGAVRDNLTSTHCNIPLRINGPVVADKLLLRRTAGSDAQVNARGNPAEIFNLRADAYLWGSAYGLDNNRARTVYTRELAPRF